MIIATFNINSINARLPSFLEWLKKTTPDVVLLQEIKTAFDLFPFFELSSIGYNAKVLGQKSYNGVAILSRHKMNVVTEGLPDFTDENARYLEVDLTIKDQKYRVASVYLPNGNPPYNDPDNTEKYEYKLAFMKAFYERAAQLLEEEKNVVLGGDFNVIFTPSDVYAPETFANNALFKKSVRQRLAAMLYLGYYDAFRTLHPSENGYTFWDYAGNAFALDLGMRIDYLLVSPAMADKLSSCQVDKTLRQTERPSDHTVLTAQFLD